MVNNKILEYNHDKVIVEENDDSYVIDFQRGLGEVSYSKKDWTLARALYHQSIQNYKKEIEEDIFKEMVFGGNYLQDFISYKNYTVGTDEDEDVFYGVCLTPNTDYIKIEIY